MFRFFCLLVCVSYFFHCEFVFFSFCTFEEFLCFIARKRWKIYDKYRRNCPFPTSFFFTNLNLIPQIFFDLVRQINRRTPENPQGKKKKKCVLLWCLFCTDFMLWEGNRCACIWKKSVVEILGRKKYQVGNFGKKPRWYIEWEKPVRMAKWIHICLRRRRSPHIKNAVWNSDDHTQPFPRIFRAKK